MANNYFFTKLRRLGWTVEQCETLVKAGQENEQRDIDGKYEMIEDIAMFEDGNHVYITNPFKEALGNGWVEPVEYYGEAFLDSATFEEKKFVPLSVAQNLDRD